MFEHFRNLFQRSPKHSEEQPGDAPLPPIDLSQLEALADQDAETEELDALYREALNAMDVVETGVRSVCEDSGDDPSEITPDEKPAHAENSGEPETDENSQSTTTPVTPHQVLEAALFVGGIDLTLKRLCTLLNDEFTPEKIEQFIDELNTAYADENRPYEILFGEGGYRLSLRSEYSDVRDRVFGLQPKEFKLSQEALEVLSLVAYRQPIGNETIIALRGSNASGTLRQLLRRQLIALERPDDKAGKVQYRTTRRFLEAFGLSDIDELPQSEDLSFK